MASHLLNLLANAHRWVPVASFIVLIACGTSVLADTGNSDQTQAAKYVLSKRAAIEQLHRACKADAGAKQFAYYRAAEFIWLSDNADAIYAADKVLNGKTGDIAPSTELMAATQTEDACLSLSKRIFDGAENINKAAPAVSKILSAYLAQNPIPEDKWSARETKFGCVKSALNAGKAVDEVTGCCTCLGDEYVKTTTAQQRAAYLKAVNEQNQEEMTKLKKALIPPVLQRCEKSR